MAKVTLYHGTSVNNLNSIMEQGIKQMFEGVYLTDSAESAARWCGFKLAMIGEKRVAVIEVEVDDDNIEPGMDHSPMMHTMFGVGESFLHHGDVTKDKLREEYIYEVQSVNKTATP